jgi:hypothetical protein
MNLSGATPCTAAPVECFVAAISRGKRFSTWAGRNGQSHLKVDSYIPSGASRSCKRDATDLPIQHVPMSGQWTLHQDVKHLMAIGETE